MTISVRLSEEIEKLLRDEAQNEKKNISEIVNSALEKYYFMHKYFDSIHSMYVDVPLPENLIQFSYSTV